MHIPRFERSIGVAAAVVAALMTGTAQAALQDRDLDRDGQTDAFYDTDLDITWLRDANVNGYMTWTTAAAWADGLVFGGFDDWRLPKADPTCAESCPTSEMGHLWSVGLGNPTGGPMNNTGGFQNIVFGATNAPAYYWTGQLLPPPNLGSWAFVFNMNNGFQGGRYVANPEVAMAVRDGDVPAVPEPGTYALMLAGLGMLMVARRPR